MDLTAIHFLPLQIALFSRSGQRGLPIWGGYGSRINRQVML